MDRTLVTTSDRVRRGEPWTVEVAMGSARHRWPVFGLWFLCTIGLFAVSLALGGTKAQNAVSNDDRAKYEAAHAYDVFNAGGTKDPSSVLYLIVSSRSSTVDDPQYAAAVAKIVSQLGTAKGTVNGQQVATFGDLKNPLMLPPGSNVISPDRTTLRVVGEIKGDGPEVESKLLPIPGLVAQMRLENPGFQIYALNNTLANNEISTVINNDLDGSLRLTIPLTFIILLVAFGAVVAAAVPLILAISSLPAAFGVLGIYTPTVGPGRP